MYTVLGRILRKKWMKTQWKFGALNDKENCTLADNLNASFTSLLSTSKKSRQHFKIFKKYLESL